MTAKLRDKGVVLPRDQQAPAQALREILFDAPQRARFSERAHERSSIKALYCCLLRDSSHATS